MDTTPAPDSSPLAQLSDYHIHTPLCHHATGWPLDYAARALQLQLGELGFADHSPMPAHFDDWRMLREDLPRYLDSIAEARARYPQLTIRIGLEVDYLPGHEKWIEQLASLAPWDFLIGSVHYLPEGWEVDHPKYISRHQPETAPATWASYWETLEQAIRTRLFDFIAHPDLPKKFGLRPPGDLRPYYEPVIAALAETRTAFEINTAGLRKECRELYPSLEFLQLARQANVPLLINSDSHHPDELCAGFPEAIAHAHAAGYTHILRYQRRVPVSVPLPPP